MHRFVYQLLKWIKEHRNTASLLWKPHLFPRVWSQNDVHSTADAYADNERLQSSQSTATAAVGGPHAEGSSVLSKLRDADRHWPVCHFVATLLWWSDPTSAFLHSHKAAPAKDETARSPTMQSSGKSLSRSTVQRHPFPSRKPGDDTDFNDA